MSSSSSNPTLQIAPSPSPVAVTTEEAPTRAQFMLRRYASTIHKAETKTLFEPCDPLRQKDQLTQKLEEEDQQRRKLEEQRRLEEERRRRAPRKRPSPEAEAERRLLRARLEAMERAADLDDIKVDCCRWIMKFTALGLYAMLLVPEDKLCCRLGYG